MESTLAILLIVAALALGLVVGWLVQARQASKAVATVDMLRLQLNEVVKERDAERDRAGEAAQRNATLEAEAAGFEARMKELIEAKDALAAQFREVGAAMLGEAQKQFLERAGQRFTEAEKESNTKLQLLLKPVEETLKRYEAGLKAVEKERVDQYAGLREAVQQLQAGHVQVRDETRNLVNALRSNPKARGRWGEQSLRNVLEQAGLSPYADFKSEVSVEGEAGRLRPDVVVRLPGGRELIIDAKCSLNAYLDGCDEADDERRTAFMQAHLASIRTHVQQLSAKSYWAEFGQSADYVAMYIPGEHFLTAALEQDHDLWEWAHDRRVLLVTPTNLVALARTAASYWRQDQQNREAAEIAKLGRELHSRLATMADHMVRVGKNLATANSAYNQMVGSFESQVLTQARRFETFGAGSAKEIASPPMIEASPRPLTKVGSNDTSEAAE